MLAASAQHACACSTVHTRIKQAKQTNSPFLNFELSKTQSRTHTVQGLYSLHQRAPDLDLFFKFAPVQCLTQALYTFVPHTLQQPPTALPSAPKTAKCKFAPHKSSLESSNTVRCAKCEQSSSTSWLPRHDCNVGAPVVATTAATTGAGSHKNHL